MVYSGNKRDPPFVVTKATILCCNKWTLFDPSFCVCMTGESCSLFESQTQVTLVDLCPGPSPPRGGRGVRSEWWVNKEE